MAASSITEARSALTSRLVIVVLFGKYSGTEIKLDGEEYLILREDDVLGVIEGATKARSAK